MTDTATETATFTLAKAGMLNTRLGLDVLAQGLLGEKITFTKLAIGDGFLNVTTESEYREAVLNLTAMKKWRLDLPIVEMTNQGDGRVLLHAIKTNAEVPEGFFAKEQAVFAINPRTGEEILYSYRNSGESSSFIPSNTGPVTKTIDLGLLTVIQNAKNVEAKIDTSFSYVSIADFKEHVDSAHPHLNTPNHYLNVTDTNKFWAVDNDNDLHQISVENAREVILGDAANLFPTIGKTITDLRDKLTRQDVFTSAKEELGLDANLLVVEDFNPTTTLDTFKKKVLSCAEGGNLIGVENDGDIVAGRYYWITDGVNQEVVQVESIVYSTDLYHVKLVERLTHSYNPATTYLYRSLITSSVESVDKKFVVWNPTNSFKGIEANVEREIILNTSLANMPALIVEGDGIVTADGFMTMTNNYVAVAGGESD